MRKWSVMSRYAEDVDGGTRIKQCRFKLVAKLWCKVYNKIDNEEGCPEIIYFVSEQKKEDFYHAIWSSN